MDYSKIDNIEIEKASHGADAYVRSADYDGRPMTIEELDSVPDSVWMEKISL